MKAGNGLIWCLLPCCGAIQVVATLGQFGFCPCRFLIRRGISAWRRPVQVRVTALRSPTLMLGRIETSRSKQRGAAQ
jgi:hypothetical protein